MHMPEYVQIWLLCNILIGSLRIYESSAEFSGEAMRFVSCCWSVWMRERECGDTEPDIRMGKVWLSIGITTPITCTCVCHSVNDEPRGGPALHYLLCCEPQIGEEMMMPPSSNRKTQTKLSDYESGCFFSYVIPTLLLPRYKQGLSGFRAVGFGMRSASS